MRNAAAARACHFTTKSMISLRAAMKFHYYPETDSLYIDLSERVGADAREVARGVALDFDTDGQLVGIDIDNASKIVDLSRLEAKALPVSNLSVSQR